MLMKTYSKILNDLMSGKQPDFDSNEYKNYELVELLQSLKEDGYIRIDGTGYVNSHNSFYVTPKGALALFEWEEAMSRDKRRTSDRLWLIATTVLGAILVAVGKYIAS